MKKEYHSPTTAIDAIATGDVCIGFGEGSIPPEDSDSNMGWLDDESDEEYRQPDITARLWDE